MRDRLEELGLSAAEAGAYLALVRHGGLAAKDLAEQAAIPRSSIYPVLASLADKGLIENGVGRGSVAHVVPPERALNLLIDCEREALAAHERIVKGLVDELSSLHNQPVPSVNGIVEVLRDRRVIGERYDRLQLEAEREIDTLVKAPMIVTLHGNPAAETALKRGVRTRGLYEPAVLETDEIGPYLKRWIGLGEEARVYTGELPIKFALFDAATVLMPLETPEARHQVTSVLMRHPAMGAALRMLFDFLWERAKPIQFD